MDRLTSDSALKALGMPTDRHQLHTGLLHNSDRGRQSADCDYEQMLKVWGTEVSISDAGTRYDNPPDAALFGHAEERVSAPLRVPHSARGWH